MVKIQSFWTSAPIILVESLSEDEIKYIDKYAEYKKYEVARHSESLEYYVIDLVNEDLVMKI